MDGLSGAASVIAVIDISAKIFDLCQTYLSTVKEAKKDIRRLRDGVTALQDVMTDVNDLAEDPSSSTRSVFSRLNQHNGPVQQCEKDLRNLVAQLDSMKGENEMKRFGVRALKWPFSSKEVDKRLQIINEHKATFTLALTSDHLALSRSIKNDIAMLSDGIADIQTEQRIWVTSEKQQRMRHWLSSPGPSSKHTTACKIREPTTGEWFLKSDEFKEWTTTSGSFLWLHGIPGCGKSVLCSTIIEEVKSRYKCNTAVAIAFFYFDFNEQQGHDKYVRSLVEQLAWQSPKALSSLESLFSHCQDGSHQPTPDALESTFQQMLVDHEESFIILDALDECEKRKDLLLLLEKLNSLGLEKLHILATSRRERDIEEALTPLTTSQICLQNARVNNDIRTHISERLQNDPKLKKWPVPVREEIERTLVAGSQGMFRWVGCQLDVLRDCLRLNDLRNKLKSLPTTLDETYARILENINISYRQDAFRILQWLVFSARPLLLEEVAEILAIDTKKSKFDPEDRLPDPLDLLVICSSLITIVKVSSKNVYYRPPKMRTEVRLAHFSVKEYLISDRIRNDLAVLFIQSKAEEEVTLGCLTYLLHFQRGVLTSENLKEFSLARYAAEYWFFHFRALEDSTPTSMLAMQLFQGDTFVNWIRIFSPDEPWMDSDISKSPTAAATPLYYSSLQGCFRLVVLLLESGANVNVQGGKYGNALQAASINGHEAIVKLLLENGANVNAQGGEYGSALQAASSQSHEAIVKLLLENGADINAQGGDYGNALQAASIGGHEVIIQLLLENGANVNAQGGDYGNALQAASIGGHEAIIQLLVEKGADVNA